MSLLPSVNARRLLVGILLFLFAPGVFAASISWTGGGDGVSWSDPNNWSSAPNLPGPADDASIGFNSGNPVNITTTVSIHSLSSNATINLSGGSLTLAASSSVSGNFTADNGATLTVNGTNASFTATGPTNLTAANLDAQNGGTMAFPEAASYTGDARNGDSILATGPGSKINLSDLATFVGGYDTAVTITASGGGEVDLAGAVSNNTQITLADNLSVFNVAGVTSLSGTEGTSVSVNVSGGGAINFANVTQLTAVNLTAGTSGNEATAGQILFPKATSYTGSSGNSILATGPGSKINLSDLAAFVGAYDTAVTVTASGGGEVDLAGAVSDNTQITLADNVSVFNVAGVTSLSSTNVNVSGGGMLNFANTTILSQVNLMAGTSGNNVTTGQILFPMATSYTGNPPSGDSILATGPGSKINLSDLATFVGGYDTAVTITASGGGEVDLAGAVSNNTQITLADNLSVFNVAGVTSLSGTEGTSVSVNVSGGGAINFANVTQLTAVNLTAGTSGNEATAGQILFPKATSYTGSSGNSILATGPGSKINLSDLAAFVGAYDTAVTVTASGGGEVDLAGAVSDNTQITLADNVSVFNVAGVTSLSSTNVNVSGGGMLNFANTTILSQVNLMAGTSGNNVTTGQILFPMATSYTGNPPSGDSILATGPGSKINLSDLATFVGGYDTAVTITASGGGEVDLAGAVSNNTQITLADNLSVFNVAGVTSLSGTEGTSVSVNVSGGGAINFANVTQLTAVNLTAGTSGNEATAGQILFPKATSYTGLTVNASTGGEVILAGVVASSTQFTISDATSTLNLTGNTGGSIAATTTDNGSLLFTQSAASTASGVISGTGTVTQNGTNNLTLSGSNTYSGNTTINSGTLTLAGNTSALASNIIDDTALVFAQSAASSYNGVISGNGTVTQAGPNNLTLSGNNTYTGNTTLSGGTLTLGNPLTLANTTVVDTGGTLNFGAQTAATLGGLSGNSNIAFGLALTIGGDNQSTTYSGNFSGPGSLALVGNGTLTLSGANTYSGNTTISSGMLNLAGNTGGLTSNITDDSALVFSQSAAGTYAGVISGNGVVTQAGAGTLTLGGNNTYTGVTTISSGTLTLANSLALQDSTLSYNTGSGNLSFGNLTSATLGGLSGNQNLALTNNASAAVVLTVGGNNQNNVYSGNLSGPGYLVLAGTGTQILSGNNTYSGNTSISSGTLTLTSNTSGLGGNITDDSALVFAQSAASTFGGAISGAGSVSQAGASALTLSGNNTYTGGTTVSAGTLALANNGAVSATGTGPVNITASASLAGTGLAAGNTIINGTLLPGSVGAAGLLSFGANLTLASGAAADFQLGGATRGTQYSAVDVAGTLSLGGVLTVNVLNSFALALGSNFDLFQAGDLTGAFTSVVLPALNANLSWDTATLATTGAISTGAINFTQWASAAGLSGNNALPAATPFGGAPANVIRYAMNLDITPTPANLPQPTLTSSGGANYLTIQYRARKDMTDYQLVPQYSTDLVNWTNVDSGNITPLTDADAYTAQFQASVLFPAQGTIFLRVAASPQ